MQFKEFRGSGSSQVLVIQVLKRASKKNIFLKIDLVDIHLEYRLLIKILVVLYIILV